MYEIQCYNYVKDYFHVYRCRCMLEKQNYIKGLLDSKEYVSAGINCRWLARY